MTSEIAFVALGSNLGDRFAHLAFARAQLARLPDTTIEAVSSIEETAPLGPEGQGPYLNQMVKLRTSMTPKGLLAACLALERERGRIRARRWAPRTLDLDVVLFGDRVIDSPDLTVPHPEIANRDFWQRELAELEAHVHG